jgi:hypothetical protein
MMRASPVLKYRWTYPSCSLRIGSGMSRLTLRPMTSSALCEQCFGGVVERLDHAAVIDNDHGIDVCIEQCQSSSALRLPGFNSIGLWRSWIACAPRSVSSSTVSLGGSSNWS